MSLVFVYFLINSLFQTQLKTLSCNSFMIISFCRKLLVNSTIGSTQVWACASLRGFSALSGWVQQTNKTRTLKLFIDESATQKEKVQGPWLSLSLFYKISHLGVIEDGHIHFKNICFYGERDRFGFA